MNTLFAKYENLFLLFLALVLLVLVERLRQDRTDDAEEIEYDQILGRTMTTSRGQKVQLGRLISIESRPEISVVIPAMNEVGERYSRGEIFLAAVDRHRKEVRS